MAHLFLLTSFAISRNRGSMSEFRAALNAAGHQSTAVAENPRQGQKKAVIQTAIESELVANTDIKPINGSILIHMTHF